MRNGNELNGLIIGIGRIVFMMGQLIFVLGVISCWLGAGLLFSVYLMCVGIGVVIIFSQKIKNIYIVKIIRKYQSRKRKNLPKQKDSESVP